MPRVTRQAVKASASPEAADRDALGEIDENVSPPPSEPKKTRSRSKAAPKDQEPDNAKPTRKTRGRGKKVETNFEESTAEEEKIPYEELTEDEPAKEEVVEAPKENKKSKGRKARGRGRKNAIEEPTQDKEGTQVDETPVKEEAGEVLVKEEEEAPKDTKQTNTTRKTRGRGRRATNEVEEVNPVEEQPAEEEVVEEAPRVEELEYAPVEEEETVVSSSDVIVEDAKVEENELEQLSDEMNEETTTAQDITPETPKHEILPVRPKTPRFDPEVYNEELDIGNDSFKMYCSPRKSARSTMTSEEAAIPHVEEEITEPEPTPIHVVKKTRQDKPKETTRPKANEIRKSSRTIPAPVVKSKPAAAAIKPVKPSSTTATRRESIQGPAKPRTNATARTRPSSMILPSSTNSLNRTRSVSAQISKVPKAEEAAKIEKPVTTRPRFVPPPPFQPVKSSKPPTKSTFELPGEALSRKFAAQREERRKKEEVEAEANKKKPFKAKPVPKNLFTNQSTEPKENPAAATTDIKANAPLLKARKQPTVAVSPQMMSRSKQKEAAEKKIVAQPAVMDRKEQAAAVLRARREAAENGRNAVKMWAEQQKQKELVRTKDTTASASTPIV